MGNKFSCMSAAYDPKVRLPNELFELPLSAVSVAISITVLFDAKIKPALDERLLLFLIAEFTLWEVRVSLPFRGCI